MLGVGQSRGGPGPQPPGRLDMRRTGMFWAAPRPRQAGHGLVDERPRRRNRNSGAAGLGLTGDVDEGLLRFSSNGEAGGRGLTSSQRSKSPRPAAAAIQVSSCVLVNWACWWAAPASSAGPATALIPGGGGRFYPQGADPLNGGRATADPEGRPKPSPAASLACLP